VHVVGIYPRCDKADKLRGGAPLNKHFHLENKSIGRGEKVINKEKV
jgi:hypothetical protein